MICKKLNHQYEKIKNKKEQKVEKEKALGTYNKQYKQWCRKCGKYSHKPRDMRCPENKNRKGEKNKKTENMKIKAKNLMGYATIVEGKDI